VKVRFTYILFSDRIHYYLNKVIKEIGGLVLLTSFVPNDVEAS